MADGGELHVEWRVTDDHVILTGPVEDEGEVDQMVIRWSSNGNLMVI